MTREGEIVMLRENLATAGHLGDRLVEIRARIDGLVPMLPERLRSLAGEEHIYVLAFLKTFEQLEETLGQTLKTIAIMMQLGRIERLAPRDVALRAVALGVLADGKAWADAVRVRNELAHEYPLEPTKQAAQVNAAWDKSETLFDTARQITAFVERERLLLGDL